MTIEAEGERPDSKECGREARTEQVGHHDATPRHAGRVAKHRDRGLAVEMMEELAHRHHVDARRAEGEGRHAPEGHGEFASSRHPGGGAEAFEAEGPDRRASCGPPAAERGRDVAGAGAEIEEGECWVLDAGC